MWAWRSLQKRTAIVNLKSGKAFSGVLWEVAAEYVVMKNAQLHERQLSPTPVDGDIVIPRSQVDFIQMTGGDG